MEIVKVRALAARLSRRKQQIAVTLSHLESERSEVEKNTEWKDALARQKRRNLLNYDSATARAVYSELRFLCRLGGGNDVYAVDHPWLLDRFGFL